MLLKISFLTLISDASIGVHYGLIYAAIQNVSDFNFAVAGDWGCDSKTQATVRNIQNRTPELDS
jgi:hypothetical protein